MGQIPLPSYAYLKIVAGGDEEIVHAFVRGMVLNPPRQSLWANWRTRKLRRRILEAEKT